jgi:hypothetical protein
MIEWESENIMQIKIKSRNVTLRRMDGKLITISALRHLSVPDIALHFPLHSRIMQNGSYLMRVARKDFESMTLLNDMRKEGERNVNRRLSSLVIMLIHHRRHPINTSRGFVILQRSVLFICSNGVMSGKMHDRMAMKTMTMIMLLILCNEDSFWNANIYSLIFIHFFCQVREKLKDFLNNWNGNFLLRREMEFS